MTLNEAIKILALANVPSAEHDAREIFAKIGGFKPYELVNRQISTENPAVIDAVGRRAEREPLQYIIGEVGFYRESYEVSPVCLIPREDTELLVDFAVRSIPEGEGFIDICTGSGCIAVSVLKNTNSTNALAVDISEEALALAARNAERNGVSKRIEFKTADALEFVPEKQVFAVLSNPPYVTDVEYATLSEEIYKEPKIAFVGGTDGLDFYEKIVPNTGDWIKDGGFIAFEIGCTQADALRKIAEKNSLFCEIHKDLSGNDRLAVLRKK